MILPACFSKAHATPSHPSPRPPPLLPLPAAGFSEAVLRTVADNMEVCNYVENDDIIVQNDTGDAFYVLEMGRVKIMRKANAYEDAHEIRRLGKGAHFGELSLLNEEPRSATVTVVSESARALKLSKVAFDEIITKIRTLGGDRKKEVSGKMIVERVPLFKTLSAAMKKKILDTMEVQKFTPGTYICKQGTNGTSFYIITSGECKITLNTEGGREKEVRQYTAGDFFGENALVDVTASKRTANVIATDDVTCMTLSKADFNYLMKGVKVRCLFQQWGRCNGTCTSVALLGRPTLTLTLTLTLNLTLTLKPLPLPLP